ncbi:fused MFS/spermidine synthase [Nitrosomonas sp.]|uniref:fused MFS/spermidine synthase n=1 Tax=Nitrosomonas sp. TaxID=42353 RepID=UPI002730D263|nr:fused MFS/spermidine synthase [Nitrosomonas sp.]MBK6957850.1 fused MFS/spermidine synthase [Nitrosomonas sp.]MDP2225687.1 fused MFS/spermidine synthase [Nitrosomonas sp.]
MNQPASNILGKVWLYCTVFLTGAAVMVIELLGTRLIAPFYGASLYVWTSVISVTLIALALGYFIGGRWADRAKNTGLALIIALSGLLTLVIPWLTGPILLATDSLGLRMGVFVSTLVLFSPSLIMLGMIGPFAVKLATSSLEGVGASAGSIYAVSTVGSVIGTLFLGFYLFPQVGSREIFLGLGIALLALALVVVYFERQHLRLIITLPPVAVLTIIGIFLIPFIAEPANNASKADNHKVQFERESLYGWVRVIDKPAENFRLLTVDASTIGAASISHGENVLTYQKIVNLLPILAPNIKHALLVGQGAGHMAMTLKEYGIVTDTLEIDPAVAEAASSYFGFIPTGQTIIGDARYEIRQLSGPYDLIIMDVFTGGSEPTHLLTVEALAQLHALLTNQGILALNFVSFLDNGQNAALASVAKTLAQVFPYQQVFISEPDTDFNDFIFLATNHAMNLNDESLSDTHRTWLKQRLVNIDQARGMTLTDNLSSLEHLQIRKSEHYRRMIVDLFGTSHFIR